jgi:phosphopantetheinyl transferase
MDERKNIEGLAKRAFSSAEREFLASAADSAERLTRFYQIWTFKESYIKLYGLSIFDSLKVNAPDFTSDTLRSAFLQENNAFRQYRLEKGAAERYILCCIWKTRGFLEYGGEETSPEIRWFSKSLPLTSISPAAC